MYAKAFVDYDDLGVFAGSPDQVRINLLLFLKSSYLHFLSFLLLLGNIKLHQL